MNSSGFRDGFQRVPRQCTFHNACLGLGPRHIHHGFRTGSNGFRGNALFIMRAGARAPGTFTTDSERVPTGSEAVHFSQCVLAPGPQAHLPRVPTGSEAVHFSQCVLAPRPQAHLPRVPNGFQRVPRQCTFRNACWRPGPRHMYHGFRTGSNGFRGSALFVMRSGAQAPGTCTTGSGWVPTGSKAVNFS